MYVILHNKSKFIKIMGYHYREMLDLEVLISKKKSYQIEYKCIFYLYIMITIVFNNFDRNTFETGIIYIYNVYV